MENERIELTDVQIQNEASDFVESEQIIPDYGQKESTNEAISISIVQKTTKTAILYISFLSYGLSQYLLGPSILHMRILFAINLTTISAVFIGQACGIIAGSGLCGIIFARFSPEIQLCLACFVLGATAIIAPWTGNFHLFFLTLVFQGLAMGFIGTGGIAYCTSLWTAHRHKQPIMQGLWCAWSMGATVAPLVISQFLVPLENLQVNINDTDTFYQTHSPQSDSAVQYMNYTISKTEEDIGLVRYGYMAIGTFAVLSGLPYFIVFKIFRPTGSSLHHTLGSDTIMERKTQQDRRIFTLLTLILISCYGFCILFIESIIGSFLVVFVFETLNWSLEMGSRLASTVWGLHAFGRFLGVPVSIFMKPRSMLVVSHSLILTAHILMALITWVGGSFMWASACMTGLGMATICASMLLLASEYVTLTARTSAAIYVGSTLGCVVAPPLTAYVFEKYREVSIPYVLIIANVMSILLFGAILINVWFYKYSTRNQHPNTKQNN